jgi:hypothetical protein
MASRLVSGKGGTVFCPFCGREATYEIEEVITDYGTDWVVLSEDQCQHLQAGEWHVFRDGSVGVLAYSEDEEDE